MSSWKCVKCGHHNAYWRSLCVVCQDTKPILMPKTLTAENGAKALLVGEFNEITVTTCDKCEGCGCDVCGGLGEIVTPVAITWINIKAIYEMVADRLGKEL